MPDIYINTERSVDRSIVAGINQPQREAPAGTLVAGSSYDINLYFVNNDGTYDAASGDAGTDVKLAIGTISTPQDGTFTLTDGTDTTTALSYGVSAQVVEDALNALNSNTGTSLGTASLVDVVKQSDTQYSVTMRTFGAMTALGGSSVSLTPESSVAGSIAATGSATEYAQQLIEIARQPAIYQPTWTTITNGHTATVALTTTRLLQSMVLESGEPFYLEVKLDGETVAREVVSVEPSTMPTSVFSEAALTSAYMLAATYDPIINANTAKETNTITNLSIGNQTSGRLELVSSDGSNIDIPMAGAFTAGLMDANESAKLGQQSGINTGDQDLTAAPVSTAQQAALDLKLDGLETGVIIPDDPNTLVLRAAADDDDKYELWNAGNNYQPTSTAHDVPSGMGRNNWSHMINWNMALDQTGTAFWKQVINSYQMQLMEFGLEGISMHMVKDMGVDGNFSSVNHMVWCIRPENITHGGQNPESPYDASELRDYQDNYALIQHKIMDLYILNHYTLGDDTSGWYEETNPFVVYASDCELGNAKFQDAGAIAIRSWGGTIGNQAESLSIVFDKARNNSWDQTAPLDGDIVGQMKFRVWDGAAWLGHTALKVVCEGNVGVNDADLTYVFQGGNDVAGLGNYATLGKNGLELGGDNDGSTYQDFTLSNSARNTNYSGLGVAQFGYGQLTQTSGTSGGMMIRGMVDRNEQGFPLLFQGVCGQLNNSVTPTNPIVTFRAYAQNNAGSVSTPATASTIASFQLGATEKVAFDGSGHITAAGVITTGNYTVATLPTVAAGSSCYVSDGSVVHAGNSGTVAAGAGANFVPVYYDGTNWRIS